MGRHKYDTHRPAFGWAPPAQPAPAALAADAEGSGCGAAQRLTMGEGVLDVAKSLAKKLGPKAVSGLARNLGRKVGEEIVGTPAVRAAERPTPLARAANASLGPSAQQPNTLSAARPAGKTQQPNDWGKKEADGDRIREILEANPLEQKESSPSKRQDKGRLGPRPDTPFGRLRLRQSLPKVQRSVGVSNKANEVISRLMADDDD